MAEDEGPSEWETFREEELDLSARVALEALQPALANAVEASQSLEALLDEGESLLQDFRGGNPQLLERFCTNESLRSLVQHATQPACQGVSPERLRHRSHTAAELLASCGQGSAKDDHWKVQLMEGFVAEGDTSLLDLLWGFVLDMPVDPSLPSWNVLAGYFCSIVMALLHHFPTKVAAYLRDRRDALFTNFIFFLGTRCLAELFAALICLDMEGPPLFQVEGLMIRLVQQFSGVRPDGDDADENLALVIKTIVSQACSNSITFACAVIEQLSSAEVIGTLLDKVIDLKSASAASVMSMAISRLFQLSPNPLLPIRGPNLLKPLEEETQQEIPEAESFCLGIPEASSALVQSVSKELPRLCNGIFGHQQQPVETVAPPSMPRPDPLREAIKILLEAKEGELFSQETWSCFCALGSPDVEEVLMSMEALIREETSSEAWLSAQMLSRLRSRRAAAKLEEYQMREKAQRAPFSGQLAVEAAFILVELNRTQDSDILQVFLQQDLLTRCIHFLLSPGPPPGSVMLNTVCALCLEVIRGPQNASVQAVCRCLDEGHAMGQLALALSKASAFREAASQKANRDEAHPPELTGFLRKICVELRDAAGMLPEVQERLDSMKCWTEVVLPDLEEFSQLEQEPLGGFPKLESPSCFHVNVEDAEFTPEDLRDIDEDLDTEFLLDLGKLTQRQAQAFVAARKEDPQLDSSWRLGSQANEDEDHGEWV